MEIRDVLLQVADLFERKPDSYNFDLVMAPATEDVGGCVIGHAVRIQDKPWVGSVGNIDVPNGVFYQRMDELETLHKGEDPAVVMPGPLKRRVPAPPHFYPVTTSWTRDPAYCAMLLRKYVEKYHPLPVLGTVPIKKDGEPYDYFPGA